MCYYFGEQPVRHSRIAKEDALTAYKAVNRASRPSFFRRRPRFLSPFNGFRYWMTGRVMLGGSGLSYRNEHGIYSFKSPESARSYHAGNSVIKIKIWGEVLEYDGPQYDPAYRYHPAHMYWRNPGYRSTMATMVEEVK